MRRTTGILLLSFLLLARLAYPAVEVVNAKKGTIKLSPEVAVAGEVTLPGDPVSDADVSKGSLPRLVGCQDSPWGILLSTSKATFLFDPGCKAVLRSVPVSDVMNIIRLFPESDEFLVAHVRGDKVLCSRTDMTTGKIAWSADLGFVSSFFHSSASCQPLRSYLGFPYSGDVAFYHYVFPSLVSLTEDSKILFYGLTHRGSRGLAESFLSLPSKEMTDWGIKVVFLDASRGTVLQEETFDLLRDLGGPLKCFISLNRGEFRVLDTLRGTFTVSGTFGPEDVLAKKGSASPIDLRASYFEIVMNSDVHPLLTDGELLLISHGRKGSFTGPTKLETAWLKFGLDGSRKGQISPPPYSSLAFQIRNAVASEWPVVSVGLKARYPNIVPGSLVVVRKDGSVTEAPWPKIKSNLFYDLFHDGQNVYVNAWKGWYRCSIGEEGSVPVTWDEVKKVAPPELSWKLSSENRAQQGLPELPPSLFRKYVSFPAGVHTFGSFDFSNSGGIRTLRVWGSDLRKELGDILLVPALLKDNTAVLVGLSLPQNTAAFYVPMLHIKGLPKEDYDDGVWFPFGIKYLDDRQALLIVGETLNSYKAYIITRPAMEE